MQAIATQARRHGGVEGVGDRPFADQERAAEARQQAVPEGGDPAQVLVGSPRRRPRGSSGPGPSRIRRAQGGSPNASPPRRRDRAPWPADQPAKVRRPGTSRPGIHRSPGNPRWSSRRPSAPAACRWASRRRGRRRRWLRAQPDQRLGERLAGALQRQPGPQELDQEDQSLSPISSSIAQPFKPAITQALLAKRAGDRLDARRREQRALLKPSATYGSNAVMADVMAPAELGASAATGVGCRRLPSPIGAMRSACCCWSTC